MMLLNLPVDVLLSLLCQLKLKDVLIVEQICRTLRDLVSTQQVWLSHLRRLDQAHAPNLPLHVDPRFLKVDELRTLVIRAVQAHGNCRNGTFGKYPHNHDDIDIELLNPPFSGVCTTTETNEPPAGRSINISPRYNLRSVKLVPGGDYLFVQWSHGFVQLIDVNSRGAVWTYPAPESTLSRVYVQNYNVDFETDGSITIVVSCHDTDDYWLAKGIIIEVFTIDTGQLTPRKLYSRRIENVIYPDILYVAVQGSFLALLCIGVDDTPDGPSCLMLVDFVSDELVFCGIPYTQAHPKIMIIKEHIFLSCYAAGPSTPVLRVLDIRHLFTTLRHTRKDSSATSTLDIDRLGFTDLTVDLPYGFVVGHATLPSLCAFHWKEESERFDQISIQFTARTEESWICQWPVLNRYVFTPRTSDAEPPSLSLISSSGIVPPPFYVEHTASACLVEQLSISGRSVMRHSAHGKGILEPTHSVVISTLDDGDDINGIQDSPLLSLRTAPKWLFGIPLPTFDLDYLSGAVISTSVHQRRIRVTYPA